MVPSSNRLGGLPLTQVMGVRVPLGLQSKYMRLLGEIPGGCIALKYASILVFYTALSSIGRSTGFQSEKLGSIPSWATIGNTQQVIMKKLVTRFGF